MSSYSGVHILSNSAKHNLIGNDYLIFNTALRIGVQERALSPPVTPSDFDSVLITGVGINEFENHNNQIAIYYDGRWIFGTPTNGYRILLLNHSIYYRFNESANEWRPETSFNELTNATNVTVDCSRGNNFWIILTGNRNFSNPINLDSGSFVGDTREIYIQLIQDGVGGRLPTFSSDWKLPTTALSFLPTTANSQSLFSFVRDDAHDALYLNAARFGA